VKRFPPVVRFVTGYARSTEPPECSQRPHGALDHLPLAPEAMMLASAALASYL